jgi:hypothetical protein
VVTCSSSSLGCVFPAKYVGTTGYHLAQLYIVFFLSGIAHAAGDVMAMGNPPNKFKSLTFFMLQPFGITFELVVSYIWRRFQPDESTPKKPTTNGSTRNAGEKDHTSNDSKSSSIPPLWIRCVGSIWVALWMVWTAAYMADVIYSARLRLRASSGQI